MKLKEPKYKYENALLIDDNELDNFINQKTLEAHHFAKKIFVNTSAKSALEFLSNLVVMGDDSRLPQVIFIDINMPMIDGFQFIEFYREKFEKQFKKTKLVILTSSVYHEDRVKAAEIAKNVLFLNKPLTKTMLDEI
jgi:CheY-like chemotaxis protein